MILDKFRKDNKLLKDKVIAHRKRVRSVYSTTEGQQELFNIIFDCGLLEPITGEQLACRNWAVKKLQEMGMLDEVVIKRLIKEYFESRPELYELSEQREYEKESKDTKKQSEPSYVTYFTDGKGNF